MGVLRVLLHAFDIDEVWGVVLASSGTPFCDGGCCDRWWCRW